MQILSRLFCSKKLYFSGDWETTAAAYTVAAVPVHPNSLYLLRNLCLSKIKDLSYCFRAGAIAVGNDPTADRSSGVSVLNKIPLDTFFSLHVYNCGMSGLAQALGDAITYPITIAGVVVNNKYDLAAMRPNIRPIDDFPEFLIPLRSGETDISLYSALQTVGTFSTLDSLQTSFDIEFYSQAELLLFVPNVYARKSNWTGYSADSSGAPGANMRTVLNDLISNLAVETNDDDVWLDPSNMHIADVEAVANFNLLQVADV